MLQRPKQSDAVLHIGLFSDLFEQTSLRAIAANDKMNIFHIGQSSYDASQNIDAFPIDQPGNNHNVNCNNNKTYKKNRINKWTELKQLSILTHFVRHPVD